MTTPSAIWRPEVGVEFGKRYLYEIADCLPIVPNMPMRKFPMLMAAAVESFIREAQSHGLVSLSEITPEVLVSLIPSKAAISRAVELWQGVDDQMNEDDFCEVMYVHFINDAGNKKKQKLTNTKSNTYDDAARAAVTAASTPRTPMTASGFYDASAAIAGKSATDKGGKFGKEIRALEIEVRRPNFTVKRNSSGPVPSQDSLLRELMALEVARLDPSRPVGRNKKGDVTKSAKELEAELKLLTGGQAALIARLLGFDGEKKATPFRMQVHVEAAATVAAPTATAPPISTVTAVAELTVIESDDDAAGMSDEDDECGGVGGGDGSGGGALGLEKGAQQQQQQQQQQRASTPPRAQPQLQPSPRSRGPKSGRSPTNSPVKVRKSARQALRHTRKGTGSSI